MKKNILLLLLVFSFSVIVFLLVNDNKMLKAKETEIQFFKNRADSLVYYKNKYKEISFFTLEENTQAQQEFLPQDYKQVLDKVMQEFTALNTFDGGNPILLNLGINSNPIVYKLSVLNHRWMIAGYKSETESGEILIEYKIKTSGQTHFDVLYHLKYK